MKKIIALLIALLAAITSYNRASRILSIEPKLDLEAATVAQESTPVYTEPTATAAPTQPTVPPTTEAPTQPTVPPTTEAPTQPTGPPTTEPPTTAPTEPVTEAPAPSYPTGSDIETPRF